MRVYLEAFDSESELLQEDYDITDIGLSNIAAILDVSVDNLVFGFDISEEQLTTLCTLAQISPHRQRRTFQVGGAAE
ncbi:DUF7683 domain-containing protein [Nocardia camponoti]|uniref:DUF7683 domain-containing protein n=1 Tax=Nocardia camponoti TaxID=1616106 RepID=A0A917QKA4_9NOCA|nr:hypothetical protein [Nocardia camponoti]GGK53363.1 hypothetical protein GCM10011591_26480 [Nocardia camponoti]